MDFILLWWLLPLKYYKIQKCDRVAFDVFRRKSRQDVCYFGIQQINEYIYFKLHPWWKWYLYYGVSEVFLVKNFTYLKDFSFMVM